MWTRKAGVLTTGCIGDVNLHRVLVRVVRNVNASLPWSVQRIANEVCSMVPTCSCFPKPVGLRSCRALLPWWVGSRIYVPKVTLVCRAW